MFAAFETFQQFAMDHLNFGIELGEGHSFGFLSCYLSDYNSYVQLKTKTEALLTVYGFAFFGL